MGTWCKMSDGSEFGERRFISSTPFDSNPGSFTHLLTSSGAAIHDDDYFLGESEASVQNALPNPTNLFSKNKQGCDKILHQIPPNTKQEPSSSENTESVDCKSPNNPSSSTNKIPGIKKRKSLQRRIMQVPMEEGSWNKQGGAGVSSDHWSWRKYGQKPIKGSPYPRGYYRCSSSKGCPARKQIERSFRDPTMLLITYAEDHNHALPAHRGSHLRSSAQTSSSSLLPHNSDSENHHHDSHSTQNESQENLQRPKSEIVDTSIEEVEGDLPDDYVAEEDNLFADFGEPPELDFANHSEEDDGSTMVDPFNLFDWSNSMTEWPNS